MAQSEFAFHQTDAMANYGNLGGPVIDITGSVVGMLVLLGPNEQWPWLINSGVSLFVDSATIAPLLDSPGYWVFNEGPRWVNANNVAFMKMGLYYTFIYFNTYDQKLAEITVDRAAYDKWKASR